MDAQQFLAEFGYIANAPGGVARLRELVLQLAISGRLVEPGISAKAISESLELAAQQRQQYGKDMGLRAARLHTTIVGAAPYAIPAHWQWVLLENLSLYIQRGKGPKYADRGDVLVVSQKCIQWSGFDSRQARFVADDSVAGYGPERFLCDGDLLWNSTGTGTAGRVAIYSDASEKRCVADSHVTVIRLSTVATPRYVWCVIASPWVQARIQPTHPDSLVSGTTQQVELATSTARALPIPCPPIEEQSRIVAKVDELMALCDQLETQQQNRRKLQNALRQSTLQALASAQSPHELQDSWQRLQANFGRLFSEPEDVRLFRDVLFDLALRGVLLPDSKLTPSGDFSDKERGPLPIGWEWKTLSDLSEYITSGSRGWKTYMTGAGDSFIRSQDIRQDALIFDSPAFVTLPERVEGKRTLVRPGDLLLTITGGNVGRCAVVPELQNNAYVSQHVALIRLQESSLSEFIHFWMINAFGGRAFLARYIYGDKPGLNLAQVGSVPIPVPPAPVLPEILTSLRRYQQLCDGLAKQLDAKREVATRLCTAAVAALTGISIEQEEEAPVKAPQTELIAPLRLGTPPDVKAQAPLATLLVRHNGEMSARDLWQRFGGEIDAFYAQLKTEVAHGWIAEPAVAEVREKSTAAAGA
ncbi:restriction endonuclease subunit S [Azoarcus sp. DN11]|uniref:restriction endonuclease subunit S n=1 Tax=Azoarcus sp. DN11 TaxID=356837 RepID=UPI001C2B908A|nr:restriction endonuclease subunit S [Azoarcus sp. DN11]